MVELAIAMLLMYVTVGAVAMWYRKNAANQPGREAVTIRSRTEGTN